MIDLKIEKALGAALQAFSNNGLNTTKIQEEFQAVFELDSDFLTKVDALDEVFNNHPQLEVLREVFFDLLMINFFSADVKKLEEDYLDSTEWEDIEEQTLDRGTELLNLLLYLNECGVCCDTMASMVLSFNPFISAFTSSWVRRGGFTL